MKLSRTVAYAVQATIQLARDPEGGPVPCSRLAAEGNMPERFLLQILRNLVTHGILRSTRGVDGGYSLIRAPADVSLLEVIEAIEGPMEVEDGSANLLAETAQQRLNEALRQVTANARRQLEAIKFSQLLEAPELPGQSGGSAPAAEAGLPPRWHVPPQAADGEPAADGDGRRSEPPAS